MEYNHLERISVKDLGHFYIGNGKKIIESKTNGCVTIQETGEKDVLINPHFIISKTYL